MFYIYIIAETGRIKNVGNESNRILTPEEQRCHADDPEVKKRTYKQHCGRKDIDVDCVEIRNRENTSKERRIAIPESLIPGRPYPIYIYLFAIVTYCLNPWMGQREAAKRTRERFGLKTFSHTTLGRALKKLEKLIEEYANEPQNEDGQTEAPDASSRKFPTVEQTKVRRDTVYSYLKEASADERPLKEEAAQLCASNYRQLPYKGAFIDACHSIVKYTYSKYHCFLL